MSHEEKLAFNRGRYKGYHDALAGRWPDHVLLVPTDPCVSVIFSAATRIRNAADAILAVGEENPQDEYSIKLIEAVDAFDDAARVLNQKILEELKS